MEGELFRTVSFCSVVHFDRPVSTADGRVTTCKDDGVTCMSCDTCTINTSECKMNTHCSVGECVCACVCVSHTTLFQRHCMQGKSHA